MIGLSTSKCSQLESEILPLFAKKHVRQDALNCLYKSCPSQRLSLSCGVLVIFLFAFLLIDVGQKEEKSMFTVSVTAQILEYIQPMNTIVNDKKTRTLLSSKNW